nr:unnamed protein product [Digitaria exilis]
MALWRVMFLLVVLLAVKVQFVSCPSDKSLKASTPAFHLGVSAPIPQSHGNDICNSSIVSCGPAESSGAKAIVNFNAAVSFFFFIVPFYCHMSDLGCAGQETICNGYSNRVILDPCCCSFVEHRSVRQCPAGGSLPTVSEIPIPGMIGSGVQSSFINYQDDFTFWLFDASIPIWLVNALISAVGAISGFLWLRHPQLCISFEYKVTSYVIGVVRGIEAYLWCSGGIASGLSTIEGETNTTDV